MPLNGKSRSAPRGWQCLGAGPPLPEFEKSARPLFACVMVDYP